MTNKIEVDVTSAVRDFYPALTASEIDLLAKRVTEKEEGTFIKNARKSCIKNIFKEKIKRIASIGTNKLMNN